MKPLARWTIGNTTPSGYECLRESIKSFSLLYDADVVICHNCDLEKLDDLPYPLHDQRKKYDIPPLGVAWKLYPPRLDIKRHEIVIDNDIVFTEPVDEIDEFFSSDLTLLLQGESRNYGRYEKYVPPDEEINSGIFGMPPGFDLHKYIQFYIGDGWERNALGPHEQSVTFDEQGLVALALLDYPHLIIPNTSVINCEHELTIGKGMHFVGLNRRSFHRPYQLYKSSKRKIHL